MNTTSSPKLGDEGKVIVTTDEVVSIKYPSPAAAVKSPVFTACHDVHPDTAAKDYTPDRFVLRNSSALPSVAGKVNVISPASVGAFN